jgi:hypothetical protein
VKVIYYKKNNWIIPLKDPKVRYIPLIPHVIDSCDPHMSLTCNGIYLNLESFNGMDPNLKNAVKVNMMSKHHKIYLDN